MSDTRVHALNQGSPPERRLSSRHRVTELAYIDIGADNGGIILDLSEEGMRFQAVGPLDDDPDISLRIQLPGSGTEIKTAAQVVWLTRSNRDAGVRFVNIPSEDRAQILDWIRAQSLPKPVSEEPADQELAANDAQPGRIAPEPPKDDWLTSANPFELPEEETEKSNQFGLGDEKRYRIPALRDLSSRAWAPAQESLAEGTNPSHEVHPPREPQAETTVRQPFAAPTESKVSEVGGPLSITPVSNNRTDSREVLDWPSPASRAFPIASVPLRPLVSPRNESFELPSSIVDSTAKSVPIPASTTATVLPVAPASNEGLWAKVAVVSALVSIFCFGLGMWVRSPGGSPVDPGRVAQTPAAQIPSEVGTGRTSPAESVSGYKARARRAPGDLAATDRNLPSSISPNVPQPLPDAQVAPLLKNGPQASSPEPLPAGDDAATAGKNLTTPTTAQPQEGTEPPAVADDSTAAKRSLATPTTEQPQDRSSGSAQTDSVTAAPAARVVGGHRLRPTDRFIPCHLTYRVEPAYPREAQQQRIEGTVKIHQVVGADGGVRSVKLLSGPSLLTSAAMDAAQHWRYLPALLNGDAVETEQDIEIEFRLPH
jgi:TonB family protein